MSKWRWKGKIYTDATKLASALAEARGRQATSWDVENSMITVYSGRVAIGSWAYTMDGLGIKVIS